MGSKSANIQSQPCAVKTENFRQNPLKHKILADNHPTIGGGIASLVGGARWAGSKEFLCYKPYGLTTVECVWDSESACCIIPLENTDI